MFCRPRRSRRRRVSCLRRRRCGRRHRRRSGGLRLSLFSRRHTNQYSSSGRIDPQLGAGGQPSTWLPPGGLVEQEWFSYLKYSQLQTHQNHYV